jgi:hypothetical protein
LKVRGISSGGFWSQFQVRIFLKFLIFLIFIKCRARFIRDFAFINILAFADLVSIPADCITGILARSMESIAIVNNADEIESRYWSVTHGRGAHLNIQRAF